MTDTGVSDQASENQDDIAVEIEDGEVLSRVWFNGDGGEISIDASGSGGLSGTSR